MTESTHTPPISSTDLAIVRQACLDAGKAIMDIYETADFGVEMKSNNSPLTLADQAGHDAIMKQLVKTNYPVLSEEGKDIAYAERSKWDKFWMVDPLDGTKEFIKRNGEFTVNIALINEGRTVFGAVYVPVTDELYIGGVGMPAQLEVGGEISALPHRNSFDPKDLHQQRALRIVASRSHLNDDTQTFLDGLIEPEIVSMGSSLKFLSLAGQKADVYPRFAPTMEWDTAAAQAVIESLGYAVLQKGTQQAVAYNKEDLLNPHFICY